MIYDLYHNENDFVTFSLLNLFLPPAKSGAKKETSIPGILCPPALHRLSGNKMLFRRKNAGSRAVLCFFTK